MKLIEKLKELEKDSQLTSTPKKLRNILNDYFPGQKTEINLIISSLDYNFIKNLASKKVLDLIEYHIIKEKIKENMGLREDLAVFIVNTWAAIYDLPIHNDKYEIITEFGSEYYKGKSGENFEILDRNGKVVSTDYFRVINKLFWKIDGFIYKDNGEKLLELQFTHIGDVSYDLIKVNINKKWGIIDIDGHIIIPIEYDIIYIASSKYFALQKGKNKYIASRLDEMISVSDIVSSLEQIDITLDKGKENEIELSASLYLKNEIYIFFSEKTVNFFEGDVIWFEEITSNKSFIPLEFNLEGKAIIEQGTAAYYPGVAYAVPVLRYNLMAVVGKIKPLTIVQNVFQVEAEIKDQKLYLYWTWPNRVLNLDIYYSNREENSTSKKISVMRDKYNPYGEKVIDCENSAPHYITLYSVVNFHNSIFKSSGYKIALYGQKIRIEYHIKVKRGLNRKGKECILNLESDSDCILKGLVLVKKKYYIPFDKQDGNIIEKFENIKFPGKLELQIGLGHIEENSYVRLFSAEDEQDVKFVPKNNECLRLW